MGLVMEDIYKMRFDAYCVEKRFLDPADYREGLEWDEYDARATHLVVRGSGDLPIGYMRIIDGRTSSLPLFDHGLRTFDASLAPRTSETVEISRMIVRSDYRHATRSVKDGFVTETDLPAPAARTAADLIQLKLLRMTYRYAFENDLNWVYAAMEPTLQRKFRMLGMPFSQAGPSGEYFGEVRPYLMDVRDMEQVLAEKFERTWEFFANDGEDPDSEVISPSKAAHAVLHHA